MSQPTFPQQVYGLVALIPAGRVMTYGQVARLLGRPRAARLVGYAMSAAPDGLPCHRVVNRLGEMAPGFIFGGQDCQRWRLEAEGTPFTKEGRIDMEEALFWPDEPA